MRQFFVFTKRLAVPIFVGIAYFGAAEIGLVLATAHPSVSPVWPPAGVALATAVLFGYRILPALQPGTH